LSLLTVPEDNPGTGAWTVEGTEPRTMSRSLTYAELAKALKITPESANRLARRKRWLREKGNARGTRRISDVLAPTQFIGERNPEVTGPHTASVSSRALASFRSSVSKPSVNQL
jgi:hypothetical protein